MKTNKKDLIKAENIDSLFINTLSPVLKYLQEYDTKTDTLQQCKLIRDKAKEVLQGFSSPKTILYFREQPNAPISVFAVEVIKTLQGLLNRATETIIQAQTKQANYMRFLQVQGRVLRAEVAQTKTELDAITKKYHILLDAIHIKQEQLQEQAEQQPPTPAPARILSLCPVLLETEPLKEFAENLSNSKAFYNITFEQVANLLGNPIQTPATPINSKSITNIALLLHYLAERNLIRTRQYKAIVAKAGLFQCYGKPVTAKQILIATRKDYFPESAGNKEQNSNIFLSVQALANSRF